MVNSSRRWLIIFAVIIGVLVISAVSLVLITNGRKVTLLDENTPQGTVQRYLIALKDKDYARAYSFLYFSPSDKTSTYNEWLNSSISPYQSNQAAWKAALGTVTQNGNNATVDVTIDVFRPGGLFNNAEYSQRMIFILTKTGDSWQITSPTYLYWMF